MFKRDSLPSTIINESGAVLHMSVWDQDIVNDDFISECFVPLTDVESMKSLALLRDVPVSRVRLGRSHKNNQPRIFNVNLHLFLFF